MGILSEILRESDRQLRNGAVELSCESPGDGLLYQGVLRHHSSANETNPFKAATVGRSACDAAFLFTQDSDGSVEATMTHFALWFRRGHRIVLRRETSMHPQGQRLAVLLTSHPFLRLPDGDKIYRGIVTELTRFNNGKKPDIIAVDPERVLVGPNQDDYELYYEHASVGDTNQHAIYIPGAEYNKRFLAEYIQRVVFQSPQEIRLNLK